MNESLHRDEFLRESSSFFPLSRKIHFKLGKGKEKGLCIGWTGVNYFFLLSWRGKSKAEMARKGKRLRSMDGVGWNWLVAGDGSVADIV